MRVLFILLAVISVLTWLGVELRGNYRDLSQVLFGLAGLLAILMIGAFFGLYGG